MTILILQFLWTIFFFPVFSWGPQGHQIISTIAESHLHPETKEKIDELLDGESLKDISRWADDIVSNDERKESRYWHYLNIPDNKSYFDIKNNNKGDLIQALYFFDSRLRDQNLSQLERVEALKFLVHLVGDLHQFFHIGCRKEKGGYFRICHWFHKKTNLHVLWDSYLLSHGLFVKGIYDDLVGIFSKRKKKKWIQGDYLDWMEDSRSMRTTTLYEIRRYREDYYYNRHENLLINQLKKAGIRLAKILNHIFLEIPLSENELQRRDEIFKINNINPDDYNTLGVDHK
ncbi:MAG: S1/P1 nuclease [Halobacteriovoraceae bacterium]|nr:S1/P1 nuclease [Halobacteriovoraceae bacterium]